MGSHLNPSSPDHILLSSHSLLRNSMLLFLLAFSPFKIHHCVLLHNPSPYLVALPKIHTSLSVMDFPISILPSPMILLYHATCCHPFLHPPIYFALYTTQNSPLIMVIRNIAFYFYILYMLFSYH